jgi:hypothetical protein
MKKIRTAINIKVPVTLNKDKMLLHLGFKKHYAGYVKDCDRGRLHLSVEPENINCHFDVDTVDGRHMTLPSEITLQKQCRKLQREIGLYKKNNITESIEAQILKNKIKKETLSREDYLKGMELLKQSNLTF